MKAKLVSEEGLNKKYFRNIDDIKVYTVNGDYVRDDDPGLDFVDYYDGGHHYVDLTEPINKQKYAKYIKELEVWIDEIFLVKLHDFDAILLHELTERYLMKNYKYNYTKAHNIANMIESKFRKIVKSSGRQEVLDFYHQFIKFCKMKFKN
jgi:hypothetical protein